MNISPSDMRELADLIDAIRDDCITAAQTARLEEILARHEDARRYYLRAMRLLGYLEQNAVTVPAVDQAPAVAAVPRRRPLRWVAAAAAMVACLALAGWWAGSTFRQGPPELVALAPAWRVEPTGAAGYRVVEPTLIRLDRGELLVESTGNSGDAASSAKTPLRIQTPLGEVVAEGTRFYVGMHEPSTKGVRPMFKPITRVLVLAGVVTLTNALGSVQGTAGELLAAEPGKAPTNLAVQANSDFAFDLYAQFAKENAGKNMFFSPYSISSALAMTAEGARGETAVEMGKVLCFPDAARRVGPDAQLIPWRTSLIHTGMADLNARLTGKKDDDAVKAVRAEIEKLRREHQAAKAKVAEARNQNKWQEYRSAVDAEKKVAARLNAASAKVDQYDLRIANALWGEKTYPFLDSYVETINKHYKTGGVFPADFKNNFPAERLRINSWVEEQTNNRIKDLIPELPPDEARLVRLILTNAIFFKGEWFVPFKEADTKDLEFTLGDGRTIQTPIMNAQDLEVGRYGAFNADGSFFDTPTRIERGKKPVLTSGADGFAVMELPYKGDDLSMVLLAPNATDGLAAIEKKLSAANVAAWIAKLRKRKTHVLLPKFKLETDYKMKQTLQAMGMVRAFTDPRMANGAEFHGMCASEDPRLRLYITKVLHKAFVEVNEKGTEAAAATAVIMSMALSTPLFTPYTPTFKADRPFVLLIRDVKTGSILFMGRMHNPAEK